MHRFIESKNFVFTLCSVIGTWFSAASLTGMFQVLAAAAGAFAAVFFAIKTYHDMQVSQRTNRNQRRGGL